MAEYEIQMREINLHNMGRMKPTKPINNKIAEDI